MVGNLILPGPLMFAEILLLFPTGRPITPRWWIVSWLAIGGTLALTATVPLLTGTVDGFPTVANPLGISEALNPLLLGVAIAGLLTSLGALVAAAVSLVLRVRRADRDEREQVKWFLYASSVALVGMGFLIFGGNATTDLIASVLLLLGWAGITVASAIAIFKYRLYDIDVVINKTVVFGALAVFITAVYVAIVVGIGSAIGTGASPTWPCRSWPPRWWRWPSARSVTASSAWPTGWSTGSGPPPTRCYPRSPRTWPPPTPPTTCSPG